MTENVSCFIFVCWYVLTFKTNINSIKCLNKKFLIRFSGLSLKTQELTALFLAARLACSTLTMSNIHTVINVISLFSTLFVIWMIRFKLKSSYIKDLDNVRLYFLVNIVTFHSFHSVIIWSIYNFTPYLFSFNEYMVLVYVQFEYVALLWTNCFLFRSSFRILVKIINVIFEKNN